MIKIVGWNETFEDAHSRKRDQLYWFQVPVGTESNGLVALRQHGTAGLAAFGVFQMLCQCHAMTSKKSLRKTGVISRSNGEPLSVEMIAYKLRIDRADLDAALALLSSEEIGWLTIDLPASATEMPRDATEMPRDDRHKQTVQYKTVQTDRPDVRSARTHRAYSEQFEEFWKMVPHKVGKSDAWKEWKKLTTAEREAATEGVWKFSQSELERQRRSNGDFQHLHPCRWLKGKRWEDQLQNEPRYTPEQLAAIERLPDCDDECPF